jgi:hypothetical protein
MSGLGLDFASLERGCQLTIVNAHLLGSDLDSLFSTWDMLKPDLPDPVAEAFLRRLLVSIMTTAKDVGSFRTAATSLQVTAETAIGQLNTAIGATKQRIQDEQSQVTQLETDMQNIQNQIAQLQQQMSSSDEFWKAFAEGLSLGIYHPIEDDINQQRNLYQQAVEKRQQARSDLVAIQANSDLLSQASQSLTLAEGLDDSTTTLENVMVRISGLAAKTEHDDTQATEATNGKVAAFFRNRFNADMTELAGWRGVFQ